MKKGFKNLMVAAGLCAATMGLMTGCQKKEEDKPYIRVSGLDVGYFQNEEINLDGAKILYYENKNDTTADEIKLTENMIANFNTETTGEKKMKVFWNNFQLEIDYSVISKEKFVDIYNNVLNNTLNAKNMHVESTRRQVGDDDEVAKIEFSNNLAYLHTLNNENFKMWYRQEDLNLYEYEIESGVATKSLVDGDLGIQGIILRMCACSDGQPLNLETFNSYTNVRYDVKGNKTIMSYNISTEDSIQLIIVDNKIVECLFVGETEEPYSYETTISYNAEDVEMVEVPTDVEWE